MPSSRCLGSRCSATSGSRAENAGDAILTRRGARWRQGGVVHATREPVGTCISDAFVRELAGFQVPTGTRYGMVYASFVSPHGA